jgi:hypothetical protein
LEGAYRADDADTVAIEYVPMWERSLEEAIANGWTAPRTASTFYFNELTSRAD